MDCQAALAPKTIEVHDHPLSPNSLDVHPTGHLVDDLEYCLHIIGDEPAQRGIAVSIVLSEAVVWHT